MSTAISFLKSSFARTLETFIGIAAGFFMLPFLVSQLGEDLYGLWVLVSSITAAFYIFDLGFASAVTRFVARHISKKEYQRVNEIISSSLAIYTVLALIIIGVSCIVAAIAPSWTENSTNDRLVQLLIIITGTSLAMEFPFKSFAGVVSSYMRYDLLSYSRIFFKLVSTTAIVLFVLNGYGLLAIAITSFCVRILSNIAFFMISKYVHNKMKVRIGFINRKTIKELFGYSSWAFLVDITQLAKNKADIFIVGSLLTTSALTMYYVGARLADYSLQFLRQAMNMTTPIFARSHAQNNMRELGNQVLLFCRLNIIMAGLSAVALIGFGEEIISVWMGPAFDTTHAYQALVFLTIGKMLLFSFSPFSSCLYAISRHRYQAWLEMGEAACGIPLSLYLIKYADLGVAGAAIGITAPFYLTRTLILPCITMKEISLSKRKFYLSILPLIFYSLTFCVVAKNLVSQALDKPSVFQLVAVLAISSIIYLCVAYWLLTPIERGHIRKLVAKFRRKQPAVTLSD